MGATAAAMSMAPVSTGVSGSGILSKRFRLEQGWKLSWHRGSLW